MSEIVAAREHERENASGQPPTTPARPTAGALRAPRGRIGRAAVVVSALVAVAVPTVTAADVAFPGRAILAVAFVLLVPGVPVIVALRVPHPLVAGSLAGATSIACTLLAATTAVATGTWNPLGWTIAISVVDLVASGWALRRLRQARPPSTVTTADRRARAGIAGRRLLALAILGAAVWMWWLATRSVHLAAAGATGLAGVLGWEYVLSVGLVAAVAVWQLLRPRLDEWVLAAAAVVLCLIIFGFVNVAEGTGSLSVAWLHVGFTRFITDHHASFTGLDARGSWPAFFAASAQLVRLAGAPDASDFLVWAPFFYNAAAILPVLAIARAITRRRRVAWLGVFIYLGANWFQQDYFSPQATAGLLYLAILATLLWSTATARHRAPHRRLWSRLVGSWRLRPGLPLGTTSAQSVAMEGVLLLSAAAIVVTHQLTPVYLVLTLLIFAALGCTRHRRLWLIVGMVFLAWFSFRATDFWAGHLSTVFGDLGRLGANFNQGVTDRVTGDPTYQLMQNLRVAYSLLLVILAAIGLWLSRRRRDALLLGLLPVAAAALVALQSYGGEVVLRVFVYSSPVLAPLAAVSLRGLFRPRPRPHRRDRRPAAEATRATRPAGRARVVLAAGALLIVLVGFGLLGTAARGVNVSFERVTKDDVAAAEALWHHVRKGDTLGYLAATGAYGGAHVGDWTTINLDPSTCGADSYRCAIDAEPHFILVSRSQNAEEELVAQVGPAAATRLADDLVRHRVYRVLYKGRSAELLVLVAKGGRA